MNKYMNKYEKWSKLPKRDIYGNQPIICHSCGKESGYTKEGLMFLVIYHDLTCQYCDAVVVPYSPVFF